MGTFYSELSSTISKDKSKKNILFSPISIRVCLILAYLGADGNTAEELKNSLNLLGDTRFIILENIRISLQKDLFDSTSVTIISGIFVDETLKISENYKEILSKLFAATSKAENIDFKNVIYSAKRINNWMKNQTRNRIQNILTSNSIDFLTDCTIISTAYFKNQWKNIFDPKLTEKRRFKVNKKCHVMVNMMHQTNEFLFGQLTDLQANVIEMPYESSDLSMLVLLPKAIDGLAALESKLKSVDLTKLSAVLKLEKLHLGFPKFKFEYDISLQPILEELGMRTMFIKNADFSYLLATNAEMCISEVKQKSLIDVNEMGTEIATFEFETLGSFSSDDIVRDFVVDHPFFFAITDKENVYFAGHVAEF